MRAVVLLLALVLQGCDFASEVLRGSAPNHAYAQTVAMDTAGVVARRVAAELPEDLATDELSMLPDGRSAVTVDWASGELVLVDLVSREVRKLTTGNSSSQHWVGNAEVPSVDPSGRRVAYTWYAYAPEGVGLPDEGSRIELRLLDIDGGTPVTLYVVGVVPAWIQPHGWSSDGRRLAAAILTADGIWQVAVVPTNGGQAEILRTLDWRSPGRIEFSPDGRYLVYDRPADPDSNNSDIYVIDLESHTEHALVTSPADDRFVGWVPGSGQIVFSSDRGGTRGVWRQSVDEDATVGDAVLVKPDFWRADAKGGLTPDGRFYYAVGVATERAVMSTLDVRAGLLGSPESLLRDEVTNPTNSSWAYPRAYWSHDGRSLALVIRTERQRPPSILVRSIQTGESREYPLPSRVLSVSPQQVQWSPEGTAIFMLAELAGSGGLPTTLPTLLWTTLLRLDLASGRTEVVEVPVEGTQFFNGFELMPGGRSVLVRRRETPQAPGLVWLSRRDLVTGSEQRIFESREGGVAFAVSPDGATVAVLHGRQQERKLVLVPSSGNGEPRTLEVPGLALSTGNVALSWESSGSALLWLKPNPGPGWSDENSSYTLVRIPIDGSSPTSATVALRPGMEAPRGGERGYPPLLSPTGDRITYVVGENASELWVLEGLPGLPAAATPPR